ncbi:MAG: O-antigen ligase family protein [Planctomycetia bacterium]|nr:O-antigen ligase family protein [Planctomycetia bacterium]
MKGFLFVHLLTLLGMSLGLFYPFVSLLIYTMFGIMYPNALWFYSLPVTFLGTGMGYSEVVAYPMIIGWFANSCGNLNLGKSLLPISLLVLYVIHITFSLIAGNWNPLGQEIVVMNIRLVLAMVIALTLCNTVTHLRWFVWSLIFGSGFVAYELNMSYFAGFNRLQVAGYAGMDNNFFAVAMVVGATLAFFTGMAEKNLVLKFFAFLAAMFQFHVVLFSMSRGGMLGLCVVGFFTFCVLPKTGSNMLFFIVVLLVGLQLAGPSVRERFMTAFVDKSERDASAHGRVVAWKNCLITMRENPFTGIGVGNWMPFSHERFNTTIEAHSTWLQTGADSGIPGLTFQLGFFFVTMYRMFPYVFGRKKLPDPRLNSFAQMVVVAVMGYTVSAQFVSLYTMEITYYTMTIGLIVLKIVNLMEREQADWEEQQLA